MAHPRPSARVSSVPTDRLDMRLPDLPEPRGRLQKPTTKNHHGRSVSAQLPLSTDHSRPTLQDLQHGHYYNAGDGVISPLQPPPSFGDAFAHSRSSSRDSTSRAVSPSIYSRPTTPTMIPPEAASSAPSSPTGKKEKKKSAWFGKSKKETSEEGRPAAWIAGHPRRPPYDVVGLLNGRPMSELWDDTDGNCLVYLFPRSTGKGASFKVDSTIFASSPVLSKLAFGDAYTGTTVPSNGDMRQMPLDTRTQGLSLNNPQTPPGSPGQRNTVPDSRTSPSSQGSRGRLSNLSNPSTETHLYLPIKFQMPQDTQAGVTTLPRPQDEAAVQDMQTLVDIRNFFAFLCGQSLIATEKKHDFFHIFMVIAAVLRLYAFTNLDGSTFGEVASGSFDTYVEELRLADVRTSREKTIEGIVLGERLKSISLYNEAFTHGAGKLAALTNMNSPKFALLSSVTDNRLIRASMDLEKRIQGVELILNDFDFSALFTGIMASKTSEERKEGVRFDSWKDGFLGFRKNYLAILKGRYGDWPPKAKSKKNDLETSGLNRLVLRDLYNDMTAVYDLLVDRQNLTSRTVIGVNHSDGAREEPTARALRAVLSEYDRSSPPVKPPIPFDLPKIPTIRSIHPNFGQDMKRDLKTIQKKLRDDDISHILLQSWNKDALANPSPFLQNFWEMEKKTAHGCTIAELTDLRIGQWIFMYVVLQALPMLACDAPGLKWTKGVEYFLCEPPRKGVPWAMNPSANGAAPGVGVRRTWFAVGEGAKVVSLPADVVEHGVEGIFRRSHCWTMAERWTQNDTVMNSALHEQEAQNAAAEVEEGLQGSQRPVSRYDLTPNTSGRTTPDLPLWSVPLPHSASSNNMLLAPDSRPNSRPHSRRASSFTFGLEALPLPQGITHDRNSILGYQSPGGEWSLSDRPRSMVAPMPQQQHAVDASKTFDAILASVEGKKGKRKG